MKRTSLVILAAPVTAAAALTPLALASQQQQQRQAPSAGSAATTVSVSAREYRFSLRPTSARHGTVTFRVRNTGRQPHDLAIGGKTTPILRPGRSATLRVNLKRGRHPYVCTVDAHASRGMRGTFRVT